MILGTFFMVATLIVTVMAILVVLDVTTLEKALADTTTLASLLGVLALATVVMVVVIRSMANLKE